MNFIFRKLKFVLALILTKFGVSVLTDLGKESYPYPRQTQGGIVRFSINKGLKIETVIDVGAAIGTNSLLDNFSDKEFVMIEPNKKFLKKLEEIAKRRKSNTFIINQLLWFESTEIPFFHHLNDETGNTIFEEQEQSLNKSYEVYRTQTLDGVLSNLHLKKPYFIKIDTQGSELEILRGGFKTLSNTEAILIEVSIHEFFINGPLVSNVFYFMSANGFKLYDICDLTYRPIDGALAQLDMLFVKKTSNLFYEKRYSNR